MGWRSKRREWFPASGGALRFRAESGRDLFMLWARALVLAATGPMPAPGRRKREPLRPELLDPPPRQLAAAFERDRRYQPWPFSGLGGPVRLSLY